VTRFLALDEEVATADWNCRKNTYDEGMQEIAPLLEKFESAHGDQIEADAQRWQDIEREARDVGWSPGTGGVETSG